MNPKEQTTHTNRLKELEKAFVKDFEAIGLKIEDTDDTIRALSEELIAQIGNERTGRLKMADEQRYYVDRADQDILLMFRLFQGRSLFGRLKWLLTGR